MPIRRCRSWLMAIHHPNGKSTTCELTGGWMSEHPKWRQMQPSSSRKLERALVIGILLGRDTMVAPHGLGVLSTGMAPSDRTLVDKNAFPTETDNYVPKIIAAAIIGKYRDRYGFTNTKYLDPIQYETVKVDANISIEVLAKCASLSEEDLVNTTSTSTVGTTNHTKFKLFMCPMQRCKDWQRYHHRHG